ncbi:cold shock domain-containing protein [Methylomonas sp. AM2-LC]|uniref:cold shock domain-containing protein n=1 Tax=Methylomonas sp. AM2-LC TaxID=3153301 RepID=UPI0032653294
MANAVYKGVLKTWKDDRGFGFIKPDNGDKDIFVHISSLKDLARRPNRGEALYYEVVEDGDGKLKAINVRTEYVSSGGTIARSNKKWVWLTILILGIVAITVAYLYQKS